MKGGVFRKEGKQGCEMDGEVLVKGKGWGKTGGGVCEVRWGVDRERGSRTGIAGGCERFLGSGRQDGVLRERTTRVEEGMKDVFVGGKVREEGDRKFTGCVEDER